MRPRYYKLVDKIAVPIEEVEKHPGIAAFEWATSYKEDRKVAHTKVNGYRVHTVFLGLDSEWRGPPLIFETIVFPVDSWENLYYMRCSTWEEAEAEHKKAVAIVEAGNIKNYYEE